MTHVRMPKANRIMGPRRFKRTGRLRPAPARVSAHALLLELEQEDQS